MRITSRLVVRGGDLGGGSDPRSGSDPVRIGSLTEWESKGIWSPSDWNRKYGIAWTNKYQRFYGMTSDSKGCAALADLLERLPVREVLEAQGKAPRMFQAFLASGAPRVVEAKHPFSFFVTEFGGLRVDDVPETGSRKLPEYD